MKKTKKRKRPGKVAEKEVKKYSSSTHLLLKKLPFRRIVQDRYRYHFKNLTGKSCIPGKDIRIQKIALETLQTITEYYLQKITQDAISNVRHFGKIRLREKDLKYMYQLKYPHIYNKTITKKRTTKNSIKSNSDSDSDSD